MARQSEEDRCKTWQKRLTAADKVYDAWDQRFQCEQLEKFYLGEQWGGLTDNQREKIAINLFFPSIEAKKPSLMFFRPKATITPRPSRSDDPGSPILVRAKLREDTVNTQIADKRLHFKQQTFLALHEAFFRFGMVEVGYSADYSENPRAGKPVLKEGTEDPMTDGKDQPVMEPNQIITDESVFVRRIPASRVRVSANAKNILEWNDWVAHYEWHYVDDLKRNPNYKNTDKLKASGKMRTGYGEHTESESDKAGMVKVWRIYDQRTKTRFTMADNADRFLQKKPYNFLPLSALKFYEILDEFLPLPPTFNWLHPQREYNETREDMRVFRRGAYRRYTYRDGSIDEDQLNKLETGGDGVYAKSNQDAPLTEVPQGRLNQGVVASIPTTKEDFNNISSVSSEQRNTAEAETATQAQIKNLRSNIRESLDREVVAEWLAEIITLMVKTIEENMALPMVIQSNVDPQALGAQQEMLRIANNWLMITADQLGSLEYDVSVDVESLSPASQDSKKQEFFTNLQTVFGNPQLSLLMLASPSLLKRALEMLDIRNDEDIQGIKEGLGMVQMMMMNQQQTGPKGQPAGGPGQTPSPQGIEQQLMSQMGPVQ